MMTPRCYNCGRFVGQTFAVWTPWGYSWQDEEPDPKYACPKCYVQWDEHDWQSHQHHWQPVRVYSNGEICLPCTCSENLIDTGNQLWCPHCYRLHEKEA